MLKDSTLLVNAVAAIDESKVEWLRMVLRSILARAVQAARALRVMWVIIGLAELAIAITFVLLLREPAGPFGPASITIGVMFLVLLAFIAALIWVLSVFVGIPKLIDDTAEVATRMIVDAKADYAAISERTGWLGSLHTLWAAGKILRQILATMKEHESRLRGVEIAVALISPAGWIAMLILAAACLLLPLIGMTVAVIRWFSF